jgi:phospholipase/carboxylesterase
MSANTIDTVEVSPEVQANASIIWMHGLGAAGEDFLPITEQFNLPQNHSIRFIFPNAPVKSITVNNGMKMRAWYDIKCFNSLNCDTNNQEDHDGILESQVIINNLIRREMDHGINPNRIILAGFSQGGAMALHTGLRFDNQLGGVICLSGYLPWSNFLPQQKNSSNQHTPIFMAHGLFDPVVPFYLGKKSYDVLKSLKYTATWHTYPMQHTIIDKEITDLGKFFKKILGYQ